MAGFFRKVASAFVELPEAEEAPAPRGASGSADDTDVADLLGQLDAAKADRRGSAPGPSAPGPGASALTLRPAPPPAVPATDLLAMTSDQVFVASGIPEGANSSHRLIKMLSGLAMFPPTQQLAMVRALDAADESWTEQGVLADARLRLQALRGHMDAVEREHARRVGSIAERGRSSQARGDGIVAEIDQQIAELQNLRQGALTETAHAIAALDVERRELDSALEGARKATSGVSGVLSNLIAFFAGHPPAHG